MHKRNLFTATAILVGALVLNACTSVQGRIDAGARSARDLHNLATFDQVIETIRDGFYDETYNGVDLDEYRNRWSRRVQDASDDDSLQAVIRTSLREFGVSHLTVIDGDVYWRYVRPELTGAPTLQYGLDLTIEGGKVFVADAPRGGAAYAAGIRSGDEVVAVDAKPALESPLLKVGMSDALFGAHYIVMGHDEKAPVDLDVRSTQDGPVTNVRVVPAPFNQIEATRQSIDVTERDGITIGYIRLYHVLNGEISEIMGKALKQEFKDADALVIDLRGSGGSPQVMSRILGMIGVGGQGRGQGATLFPDKPVVCTIDRSSRSAKEVFAHNFKRANRGILAGEPTAGAVLGSTFEVIADGTRVLLPVQDVGGLIVGGTKLEGNPVTPNVDIPIERIYTHGRDDLREGGIALAVKAAKGLLPEHAEEEDFSFVPAR